MTINRDVWLEAQLAHMRGLDNVKHVEPMHWVGDEFLVHVTPGEPTAPAGGGWAQPTEPFYLLIGRGGNRMVEVEIEDDLSDERPAQVH